MNTITAAYQANVTPATIRTWCRRGVVTATKQNGRWVIDEQSLKRRIALGRKTVQSLLNAFVDPAATRNKAMDLIDQQALIPGVCGGEYVAVSSDGDALYLVDTRIRTCGCKGYERVSRCYHLVAAMLMEDNSTMAATVYV